MEPRRVHPRILIIDDDEVCRRVLTRMLDEAGLAVVACKSATDGEAVLEEGGVDAVLVDLYDGGMRTGGAFLRRLRSDARTASVPAVAMSGGDPGDLNLCLGEGADAVLEKPFTLAQFRASLNEAELGRRRANAV